MNFKKYFIIIILAFSQISSAKDPLKEGFLFLETGEYNKAFSTFSSIKTITPQVLTAKGISKYFLKDYNGSIFYLERALKFPSEKKNWIPNYFAGISNYELRNFSKANYYFKIAFNLKPSSEISLWLGKTLFEQGDYTEAEKFLLKALKEHKKNEEIYEKLLFLYFKFDNFDKIEEIIQLGRNENINSPVFDFYEAKIYLKKGESEKAKKILLSIPKDKFAKEIDDMLSILSTTEKQSLLKKIPISKNYIIDSRKLNIYFLILGVLSLLIMGLVYRNRRKDFEQKLDFAQELMKAKDYDGCQEILDSIRVPYPEKLKIIKIKLLTLKGNFSEAIDLCEELKDIKTKETLKAYIYLLSNDLVNFQKLIDYTELTLNKTTAEELLNLKYHDTNTLKEFFINFHND